ncbi:sulfite exporter TauE/SafE family protein [Gemmatimonadota bacterium]
MEIVFPVSGVEAPIWLPPLVALVLSFFTSMAGVSGAFLLLPFQMSVLHFESPAVSPTNMVYNITGIPGGVYRYLKEGRLVWPLTVVVVVGTLPGVVIGAFLRVGILSDPRPFKAFVGVVLLYIAFRMLQQFVQSRGAGRSEDQSDAAAASTRSLDWRTEVLTFNWRELSFRFRGADHRCSTPGIVTLSFLVGVIGGAYGIGGGAIIAPVFVTFYRLPVHAVAGATLMGTFTTSIVGVLVYQAMAFAPAAEGVAVGPDWLLGALFGVGGLVGMYLGARAQRFFPSAWLKLMLGLIVLIVAARYVGGYLLS